MKRWLVVGLIVCLAAGAGAWWWWTRPEPVDPRLTEVLQLQQHVQEKMFAPPAEGAARPEMPRAEMEQMREKMEALPETLRKQAQRAMFKSMMTFMQQRVDEYFALPPEERVAALDKAIDEQEARRKMFGPPEGPPRGEAAEGSNNVSSTEAGNNGGPAATANNSAPPASGNSDTAAGSATSSSGDERRPRGPGFGPPGSGSEPTQEQRTEWLRNILEDTTPEFRAKMTEYMMQMQQRRKERGLPTFGPR